LIGTSTPARKRVRLFKTFRKKKKYRTRRKDVEDRLAINIEDTPEFKALLDKCFPKKHIKHCYKAY